MNAVYSPGFRLQPTPRRWSSVVLSGLVHAAMIGVAFNGEVHAYAAVLLNAHEIVNDVVGGEHVATTW